MFKKTDSLRKTLNISSWLSRLSRACSPIIREEADGWVGTQETGSVCEFWILKLVGPGVPITALFTCVPVDIPVMTEPGEVALIFWRDSDQLAGLEVSAHLFPGGLPVPLLCHFLFFPTSWLSGELWGWACWNLGKVLRVSPSWKGFPPENSRTKTSCAGRALPWGLSIPATCHSRWAAGHRLCRSGTLPAEPKLLALIQL